MKNQDKFRNIPHGELIVENGSITIPSIFMFSTITEMQNFLHSCKALNCTVNFKNEGLLINPGDHDGILSARLAGYGAIIVNPKLAHDYIRYLFDTNGMTWDKVIESV